MMERFNNFFTRVGLIRASGELQRMGYTKYAAHLKEEARKLG